MDMDMGSMSGTTVTSVIMQKIYWTVVGAVIGAFALVNVYTKYLGWQRLRSKSATPAKPKALTAIVLASATAILREASNTPTAHFSFRGRSVFAPTAGKVTLLLANLIVLLLLCFHGLKPSSVWSWEDIGYRTGRIALCQLPLLFLLAGKRNIVAALIGSSYERINWLHRWVSRTMLFITTVHLGFWFADWNRYDYIVDKITTDSITQRGIAAWAVLLWITISSMTPIRGWCYEFFVVQHIISFIAFGALVYLHVPANAQIFIWVCVAIFFLDRLLRAASYLYNNLLRFRSRRADGSRRTLWGSRADFEALPGGCTKVTISNPPVSWKAGQHVFLTCHAVAPFQAHPFTISSIPSDGKMEFIIQSRTGGTKRIFGHAQKCMPATRADLGYQKHVAIEGPYGRVRPLQQFDTVTTFAGSTGATFTMPLLRDLVHSCTNKAGTVTRRFKYVWVVKSGSHIECFRQQLNQVVEDCKALRAQGMDINVAISVYVTCDDAFTTKHSDFSSNVTKSLYAQSEKLISPCNSPIREDFQGPDKDGRVVVSTIEKQRTASPSTLGHKNCCCRGDVHESDANAPLCTCSGCGVEPAGTSSDDSSSLTDFKTANKEFTDVLHHDIRIYSGRPMIKDIIRTELEQARGESAVLTCGPKALISDVRLATLQLSDERAVHKGTGAQGVWLHTEAFGY